MAGAKFTHLHVHSHYSLLDGLPKISEILDCVEKLEMDSVALTDHGVLYGAVEFYKKAIKRGIKPIIGAELYLALERMNQFRPRIDDKRYHLVLLVKNEKGYKNLVKLITKAHLEGFYYKPRVDEELLAKHSEGFIVLSGCLQGKIPQLILAKKFEEVERLALKYQEIFGKENFYLELQHHPNLKEQKIVNQALISISKKYGIPLVATNDAHYLKPEDAKAQDILMLISTNANREDPERLTMIADDFSMRPPEKMIEDFRDVPEAIENTQKIKKLCNFKFKLGETILPEFQTPNGETPESYLRKLCHQGIRKRYGPFPSKEVKERLEKEFSVIEKTGFSSYFLIVQDFVNWAKENRIVVGPGRGCLLPDTKILMGNGRQKNIQEIKIRDFVISKDGKKRRVTNIFNYDVNEKVAIIKAKMPTFKKIELTLDHKVLAVRHRMCSVKEMKPTICKPTCNRSCKNKLWKNYKLEWIEAKELKKNDFLVYPITPQHHSKTIIFDLMKFDKNIKGDNKYVWYEFGSNKLIFKKIKRFIKLDGDLARLFGFYIAEGWGRTESDQATIGFGFHKDELENIREIRKLLKKVFNLTSTVKFHKTRKSCQVFGYSKIVPLFFQKLCGKGRINKHVPEQILESPNEIIIQVLTTLFKGDGSRKDTMRFSFDSVSLDLVSQVKMLLAHLGIIASIKTRRPEHKNWHTNFKLTASGKQLFYFNNLFKEFQVPIRKQKFYRNDTFIQGNYVYFPVKNIEFKDYQGKVYDFTVKKDVSYVANDITVHNSVGGSLVAYLLNITNIDPLKYNLLFERFLTSERVSPPDIDLDFTDRRRDEVINYVAQKYGRDKVSQIITFGTMAARAVIRDVGRALGYSYSYCDKIAKMIPMTLSLDQTLSQIHDFRKIYLEDEKAKTLIDFARKLEGKARHASTHACGVVISKEPLEKTVPLQHPTQNDRAIVTQYNMYDIEELGLLKIDLLGLKNLTIIENALNLIEENHKIKIDLDSIPKNDKKTFELLKKGETKSVFQLESSGMKRYLKELKPTKFEDIVVMIALYRPGPIELIPEYIKRKGGKKKIEYLHPKLEPILKETYGILIFQEQLMQVARDLAGFTLSEADVLRKAVGKKIKSLLIKQKEKFINGMIKNKIQENVAKKIWDWILPFARYGFNQAHSTCYATIAYQTAYLKTHYPVEFMAAVLGAEKGKVEEIALSIEECKNIGISVLPPDINESDESFTVTGKNEIRFGLQAIKNVGHNVVSAIIEARKREGPFNSIGDFINRIESKDLNKKSLESLIKAGVFDRLAERKQLLVNLEKLLEWKREVQRQKMVGQKGLFAEMQFNQNISLTPSKPATKKEKLNWEKELLGLFVTSHPLEDLKEILRKKVLPIAEVAREFFGEKVKILGIISGMKRIVTRNGKPMLFVTIEDGSDKIEVIAFPKVIEKKPTLFQENKIVLVSGQVDSKDGVPKIICEDIEEIVEE